MARSEGRERVGQTVSDNELSAAALFQALGYERGHTAWILRRKLDGPLPAPPLPAGYRFRAYAPGVDDLAIYELIDEAFSEWRNADSEPMGFENWAATRCGTCRRSSSSCSSTWAPLIGVSVGRDYESQDEGWIEQIAVQREHRGRGLGGALLAESFRRFQEAGRGSAAVSTDSRTGALGLYEHAGMAVVRSYTRWVKTRL